MFNFAITEIGANKILVHCNKIGKLGLLQFGVINNFVNAQHKSCQSKETRL